MGDFGDLSGITIRPVDDRRYVLPEGAGEAPAAGFGELKAKEYSPSERIGNAVRDAMMAAGAKPDVANHLVGGLGDLLGFTPVGMAGSAIDTLDAKRRGDNTGVIEGMAGMIPGARVARKAAGEVGSAVARVVRSTEIPSIRGLPVEDAVAIARTEPHLIKAGDQTDRYYIGGSREIGGKRGLTNIRNRFDNFVAADPRGGDWYDRYRKAIDEVTGGNPGQAKWMANQEGQWSAGVSPEGELGFALKENNGSLAGYPVKSARPAQHEAHERAIAGKDPALYQLGDKTGEYANLIEPRPDRVLGATGVNDFRHAVNLGYTQTDGSPQREALTAAQHKFMDYETALAVDRANKANLGGRSNWTGEQIQAAPWVRQKAEAIMSRNPKLTYEEAFERANTTIGDFFDKHTAFATHEAHPGADTGHLPGSVNASDAERAAFAADPRSSWASAPGGRDAIYAETGIPGTGNYMRVRPSVPMQGRYTRPDGVVEHNPGEVARPLVSFNAGDVKTLPQGDRALLDAGEATRGYVDAQNAAAWHKPWANGMPGKSNSLFIPMEGKATPEQLAALQEEGRKHGLGDIVDTGRGVTMTSFYPEPGDLGPAMKKGGLPQAISEVMGVPPKRVAVDSGYVDYVPHWKEGEGSGAATREMLSKVTATPEIRAAFNNNGAIPKAALDRLERDIEASGKWGKTRADIQNARAIIGEGKGWVDRLEAAVKSGAVLPALGAAIMGTATMLGGGDASARTASPYQPQANSGGAAGLADARRERQ